MTGVALSSCLAQLYVAVANSKASQAYRDLGDLIGTSNSMAVGSSSRRSLLALERLFCEGTGNEILSSLREQGGLLKVAWRSAVSLLADDLSADIPFHLIRLPTVVFETLPIRWASRTLSCG
eukprot:m.479073 g.479073  ORF g.479073 m.479073 type:complete len:122 (+) comp57173_c0_seq20:3672-4037(+)